MLYELFTELSHVRVTVNEFVRLPASVMISKRMSSPDCSVQEPCRCHKWLPWLFLKGKQFAVPHNTDTVISRRLKWQMFGPVKSPSDSFHGFLRGLDGRPGTCGKFTVDHFPVFGPNYPLGPLSCHFTSWWLINLQEERVFAQKHWDLRWENFFKSVASVCGVVYCLV